MKLFSTTVVLAIVALVMVKDVYFPSGTWRYKITVEIETPEGIKTGSAVREISMYKTPKIFPEERGYSHNVKGEAVVVDLGDRGKLFGLIEHNDYMTLFSTIDYQGDLKEKIRYYRDLYKNEGSKKYKLTQDNLNYPHFVMFKDIDDPKSVTSVLRIKRFEHRKKAIIANTPVTMLDRYETKAEYDNFEELFGKGVKIKSVMVEMTDEKVNCGLVETSLPVTYQKVIVEGWKKLSFMDRKRIAGKNTFKRGECR